MVKNPPANSGDIRDMHSIPGPGRSSGVGNGNLFQYSCLGKPHREKSLAGHSPWGCKESDMTECMCVCVHTHTHTENHITVNVNLHVNYVL